MWKGFSEVLQNYKTLALLFLCCLGASLSSLNAQTRPEVYKILGITVEGQRSAEPAAIIANTGLKVGDELTIPGEQTRQAVQRLYNLRLFADVQILIENKVQDGVYLLIRVVENSRLEKVEVVGNDELSEDDITKKIGLIKGQIVGDQDLSAVRRILKTQYDTDGYLNADVRPEYVPLNDSTRHRVVLRIVINEGPKVKVDRIVFFGNKAFDADDLKSEFKETSERRWWKIWTSNKFDKKKWKEDKDFLRNFYKKNGYRDMEILADSLHYDPTKKYLTIDIYLHEGPRYHIRNITWEGNTVYPSDVLNFHLGFKSGDIYDQEKFEQNLHRNQEETDISSLYYDNGYLTFQVDPEETRIGENSLDIKLVVHERNLFKIGKVFISGNTKTYEKVIRRELRTRPGDTFSRQAIMRSLRQLQQLNYFNPEKIKPDTRTIDDKTVDLFYDVEEKSSDTFNMSVGYSGAWGFNGGLGLTFNNFSINEPFRGGAGQTLTFDWQFGVSSYYQTFSVGFQEPWMFDTPTSFGVNLFDTHQRYYYDVRYTGASVQVGRQFRWPDDYFRGIWSVRYQRNESNTGNEFIYKGVITQVAISQVISRNSTNNPIFPSQGSLFTLSTEIDGGFLPGNANYTKHTFEADWYLPVFSNPRLALVSLNTIGYIFGFGGQQLLLPPQEYFFMGGTGLGYVAVTPLRGYEDRSAGPTDPLTGALLGGRAMIKHTLEFRVALALNPIPIYTLAFAEAGNVWLDHTVQDPLSLRRSAGVGVRLMINPIGLVGFDYAYGFDGAKPGSSPSGWKFHFQFGRGF
jgi:outer membrane protein insertion porin family